MIKAVVFDIDGTLIDSVDLHAEAWLEALKHFGHDIPFERVCQQIGKGGDQQIPALLPEDEVEGCGEEIEKVQAPPGHLRSRDGATTGHRPGGHGHDRRYPL